MNLDLKSNHDLTPDEIRDIKKFHSKKKNKIASLEELIETLLK